jgi:hypothetical protein
MRRNTTMTKKPSLLAAATAASVCLIGAGVTMPLSAGAADTVIVKGHVKSPTGKAIDDVRVAVRGADGSVKYDRTGRTGYFSVKVAGDGKYTMTVSDPGDYDNDNADGEWASESKSFSIAGQSAVVVNEVLHHGAKISGQVLKKDGSKAPSGIRVDALDAKTGEVRGFTYTRSNGAYYFRNLQEGDTIVKVSGLVDGQDARFYSSAATGTTEQSSAKVLGLDFGQKFTRRGIQFPEAGKVTGTVTVDGVAPYSTSNHESVVVSLLDSKGTVVTTEEASPEFKFPDLGAGTYYLSFSEHSYDPNFLVNEYYADAATLETATPLVVDEGKYVTGIVANLQTERPAPSTPLRTTIETKESAHSVAKGTDYGNTVTVATYGDTTGGTLTVRVNGTTTQTITLTDQNSVNVTVPTAALTAGTQRVDFTYTPTESTSGVSATSYFIVQ